VQLGILAVSFVLKDIKDSPLAKVGGINSSTQVLPAFVDELGGNVLELELGHFLDVAVAPNDELPTEGWGFVLGTAGSTNSYIV